MKSKQERLTEYVRISALLPEAEVELKRYPGVRSVAVGLKETADQATEEIVFRVYVEEKKPPERLQPGETVPDKVLGVRTDVVLHPTPRLIEDTNKYRPLMGGIQIGNDSSSGLGTMGCIAELNTDHSIVILSNHHVMMRGGAANGEKIGQPSITCCCCCKGNVVGEVVNSANNTLVDCAIARISGQPGLINEIHEIGLVFGAAALNAAGSTVAPGDRVRKRGSATGLTTGIVLTPLMNPAGKTNQIEIKPDPGVPRFALEGDSGSVVVNDQNVVVGLLFSIDDATQTLGYANLITNVTAAMNITIIKSGTAGTIPLGGEASPAALAEADANAAPMEELREALRQMEKGRAMLALFDRHGHEINTLINTNRPVKVAWHRYQGPAFTGHLIKSAREPEHQIPPEIGSVTPANLVLRMSVVLQDHGSAALSAAVAEHTLPLLNLLAGASSVQELLARAADDPADRPALQLSNAMRSDERVAP